MKNPGIWDRARARLGLAVALSLFAIVGKAGAQEAPKATDTTEKSTDADARELKVDPMVVALVDGRRVLHSDIDRRVVGRYGRELDLVPDEQKAELLAQVQEKALEELIDRAVLANKATANPQYQASDAAIDQRMKQFKEQLPPGSDLDMALDQLGLTEVSLREEVRVELAINQLLEDTMKSVGVPPAEEVRKFYDANHEFFTKRERAAARHILIATEGAPESGTLAAKLAEAEALRARLIGENAESFAEVAAAHSDCPSKSQGGALGEFGRGEMVEEFEKAAFSQKVGEIGPVVKTEFGYHIIVVDERDAGGVAPFEEVEATLPEYLAGQRREQAVETLVKELRGKAKVERYL